LGEILCGQPGRAAEAEAASRAAVELNPNSAYPWINLTQLLDEQGNREAEARACARNAILLEPELEFARIVFRALCGKHSADWSEVLPVLAKWCEKRPDAADVLEFTVDGFIRFARLTTPSEAIALIDSAAEAKVPFETLRDAFLAHADRTHLDRLAPERRVVAIELLNRISAPLPAKA
jgi:tetratricopeptide (TPR) repeat protein